MTEDRPLKDCMNDPLSAPEDRPEDLDAVLEQAGRLMYEAAVKRDGPEPVNGRDFFAWLRKKNGTDTLYDGDALAEDFKLFQEGCRIARLINESIDETEAGAECADGDEFFASLRKKHGSKV